MRYNINTTKIQQSTKSFRAMSMSGLQWPNHNTTRTGLIQTVGRSSLVATCNGYKMKTTMMSFFTRALRNRPPPFCNVSSGYDIKNFNLPHWIRLKTILEHRINMNNFLFFFFFKSTNIKEKVVFIAVFEIEFHIEFILHCFN